MARCYAPPPPVAMFHNASTGHGLQGRRLSTCHTQYECTWRCHLRK